jgi:teichoic acid transport system permease protein
LSLADWAAENGLKRIGARPPFWRYLREVWQRRGFAWTLSAYTLESANARTRLGSWWNLLLPTIQAGTYGLIFGLILGDNRPENFLPFLFTGVFLFSFMSGSFQNGAAAITGNSGLVKSLTFPRALLPLSSVIQQVINFWPQLLLLLMALLITNNPVTLDWLLLPVVMLLMTLFSFGLALFAARLNAQARDLGKLIPFVVRIAFYVSGVFFSVDKVFGQWPLVFAVFKFNPFYDYIQLARGLLVQGYEPTAELWLMCIGWAIVMPIFGLIFFWQAEEVYGRDD